MESRKLGNNGNPPNWLELLVRPLLPPLARESILGDLSERYQNPVRYLTEALLLLPYVIFSQARRSANAAILGLQGFILFACLGGFEPGHGHPGWMVAAFPTLLAYLGLVLRDVYRTNDQRSLMRALGDTATAAACVIASQAVVFTLIKAQLAEPFMLLSLPMRILATLALPVLCVLRASPSMGDTARMPQYQGAMTREELLADYDQFRLTTWWRNGAEVLASTLTVIVSIMFLMRFKPWVAPAGYTMLLGFIGVTCYLAIKGGAKRLPSTIGFAELQAIYQVELRRQHQLRRFMWWWWLVPLFVGVATNQVYRGFTTSDLLLSATGIVAIILLGYFIASLNGDRGRRVGNKISLIGKLSEAT